MMLARSTAVAGLLSLILILPATAQTTGPADGGVQRNDQATRTERAPPVDREPQPSRAPKPQPPAHADDDGFEPPPPAGCRYRENRLDLIV
ncbi:MAG: hypothetical protein ACK4TL_10855 [Hyphomicrobiaceae bacterium]